ncbi:MAG: hypothetical protein JOY62_16700 [Acidobacteriaceae bacterium]|nr:hypothetical protein [Acidobacteriaceae bacterium]MBV9781605.1 hypothetical protein [Acidobacteriaceae bacterium]
MRRIAFAYLWAVMLYGRSPVIVFTKSFPGSTPEYCSVRVDRTGALQYKESPTDDHPLTAQLEDSETAPLFTMAEKLDYFKSPLESGLKVANTGKKTFKYLPENGATTEVSFNYSMNETAQQLLDRFEQIAATERAYIELDRTIHYDKLGVNEALANIESLWLHKQLVAPQQFIPLLNRIAVHEAFMHLARERAARLRDEFQAPPTNASAKQQS